MNPYAPPGSLRSNIDAFAARYRVDTSKTTLSEFRNLSGKPVRGTLFWIAMQAGLAKFNKQVIDGPRRFADDQCSLDDLRDPVRSRLLTIADSAEKLGFHSRSYSVSNSTGVAVHGGAIRMLHASGHSFLQILASCSGAFIQGHQNIMSASMGQVTVYASSNGPPSFNTPAHVITQRRVGVSLEELLDVHTQLIAGIENPMDLRSFADVGAVIDHLSHLFYADKIARQIFVPEP